MGTLGHRYALIDQNGWSRDVDINKPLNEFILEPKVDVSPKEANQQNDLTLISAKELVNGTEGSM